VCPLQIEELFDFHVSISALLHKIALMNNLSITLALWANPIVGQHGA
jgi:hypothetical protein